MTIYFAGSRLRSFVNWSVTNTEEAVSTNGDSAYVAKVISLAPGQWISSPMIDAPLPTTAWLHFEYKTGILVSGNAIEIYNGSGQVIARLAQSGVNNFTITMVFSYWNGSTFTSPGLSFTMSVGVLYSIDIKLVCGVSGTYDVYVNKLPVLSKTGLHASVDAIGGCSFGGVGNGSRTYISQVLIADFDTRDAKVRQRDANGVSATNNSGAGSETDVSDVSDGTAGSVTAIGNKRGYTKASHTLATNHNVRALVIGARARATGGTVTDMKIGCRSGGSEAVSSARLLVAGSPLYYNRQSVFETDPATGVAWTESGVNNAESFVEAV